MNQNTAGAHETRGVRADMGDLPHGLCMPTTEYEQKGRELHLEAPSGGAGRALKSMQQREFELLIKHTLGIDFPQNRFNTLFRAHHRFHVFMIWHIALAGLRKMCLLDKRPVEHQITDKFKKHLAPLLDDWEADALLGASEALPSRPGR